MKFDIKKFIPHIIAVVLFLIVTMIYFNPALKGYILKTHDIKMYTGMSKEVVDYRNEFNEEPLWTNSMFGGMPATFVSVRYDSNLMGIVYKVITLNLPRPISIVWLYFIGFYILLLCLKIDPWLSIVGAFAFGFSSYFFIILEAGHMSKANALAFMAPTLAGFILTYRGQILKGVALTSLFFALELWANHFQITYYFMFVVLAYGASELVRFGLKSEWVEFGKRTGVVVIAISLAVLTNVANIWGTAEYTKYSTRGKSELTVNPSGQPDANEDKTSGLDKSYILDWSYGTGETYTLLVSDAKGGASVPLGMLHPDNVDSKALQSIYDNLNIAPQYRQQITQDINQREYSYWGNQKLTSGPVYVGAIVLFLFVLALPYVDDKMKWFIVGVTILTIMLSWGKNFMPLSNFFLDYFPGYNKFRAVSMILVVAEFTIPLLGILFLQKLITNRKQVFENIKYFYIASGVVGGLLVLTYILPESFFHFFPAGQGQLTSDFLAQNYPDMPIDQQMSILTFYNDSYYPVVKAVHIDIFKEDVLRSLLFVALAGGLIYLFIIEKIKSAILIAGVGLLILIDMWGVDYRYLNNKPGATSKYEYWVEKEEGVLPFYASQGDYDILMNEIGDNEKLMQEISNKINKAKQANGGTLTPAEEQSIWFGVLSMNTDFRVFTTNNPFNESRTSFFHKSIGGYHGAKLKRYQELIEFHIGRNNQKVLDMLNTKYLIQTMTDPQTGQETSVSMPRNSALGNAWFVDQIKYVDNADQEILALADTAGFEPSSIAIVDKRFESLIKPFSKDPNGSIELVEYKPNHLTYKFKASSDQLVIFSEIYYDLGWQAFIDGKPVGHFRADYVLRGLNVPAGEHTIEFKYELNSYKTGSMISMVSSVLVILLFGFMAYKEFSSAGLDQPEKEL